MRTAGPAAGGAASARTAPARDAAPPRPFAVLTAIVLGLAASSGAIGLATADDRTGFDLASLGLVLGGAVAAAMVVFRTDPLRRALAEAARAEVPAPPGRAALAAELRALLQTPGERSADGFVAFGQDLLGTGYSGRELRDILTAAADAAATRQAAVVEVLRFLATTAPVFGMVSSLVAALILLEQYGADTRGVVAALAATGITAIFGVVLARAVFVPTARRIEREAAVRYFRHRAIAEALAALAERLPRRTIGRRLAAALRRDRAAGGPS